MRRAFSYLFMLLLVAFIAASCIHVTSLNIGRGTTVSGKYTDSRGDYSETRTPGSFDSFKTSGPFNVYFVQSKDQRVLVEGEEEFVTKVITEVNNNELNIRLENGLYNNLVLRVTVFSPSIRSMKSSGSGDLKANSTITLDGNLAVRTSGSGDVFLASVICKELALSSSGSGDLMVESLNAEEASVSISGSGDATFDSITVSNDVNLRTTGSGDIRINGTCGDVDARTSGSGDISGELHYKRISQTSSGSGKIRLRKE